MTSPLRGRFGIIQRLDFYDCKSLTSIARRSAALLSIDIDSEGALEVARRSRGTPRIANRLLRRVRDYAQVRADGKINYEIACQGLELMNVDRFGFDEIDRKLLLTIIEKFGGGPVGVNTLSAAISEEKDAIEDIYEPFLIQNGFLTRTPRGRVVTPLAILDWVSNPGPLREVCLPLPKTPPIRGAPDFSSLCRSEAPQGPSWQGLRPRPLVASPRSRTRAVRRGGRESVTQPGRMFAATQ